MVQLHHPYKLNRQVGGDQNRAERRVTTLCKRRK